MSTSRWGTLYKSQYLPPTDYHELIRKYHYFDTMDPDELDALLRKIHAVYLGAVAYSDYLFGLLMAALEETGRQFNRFSKMRKNYERDL